MTDRSDRPPQQESAPRPEEKVFLTFLLPRLACPPGTNTLHYLVELKVDASLPGASAQQSRDGSSSSQRPTREIVVPTISRKVSVEIADKDAEFDPHGRRFINEVLPGRVAKDFEDQAINGDGNDANNNIRGLFFRPAEPSVEADRYIDPHYKLICECADEDLVKFCLRALTQYRKPWPYGAGREPTHIILPVGSREQLMNQKKQGDSHSLASDLDKLWGLQILTSDSVPKGRGLILAIDDIALVLADGLSWEFGQRPIHLKQGYSIMSVTHKANLLIKYPQSIMLLDGLEVAKEADKSQEVREPSKLPYIDIELDYRKTLFSKSRDILRHSGIDSEGRLNLSPLSIDNVDKVQNKLEFYYEKTRESDRLIEDRGNENGFIFRWPERGEDEEVRKLIESWLDMFPHERFIFRGQSSRWRITSTLYRSLLRVGKESDLPSIERRVLTAARYVNLPHAPESEIFANLQHFGGMTNYIDFTTRFTIALYFACKDNLENDGEVFIIRRDKFPIVYPIGPTPRYGSTSNCGCVAVAMAVTSLNFQRAMAQQGLFIRSNKGYIKSDNFTRVDNLGEDKKADFMVLTIEAEDKRNIIDYLKRTGAMEELIFFEDTMGIIERDKRFEKPCATNEDILVKLDQYDNMEREVQRQRALEQQRPAGELPKVSSNYYIGRIQYSRGCYKKAVWEFELAKSSNQSKVIPSQLDFYLASSYVRLGDCARALKQLANVREAEHNHLYHFIAADARFRLGDYRHSWHSIKKAVEMNQDNMTYLRLKILVADKLNYTKELEGCIFTYLKHCAYDPEITKLKNKLGHYENKRS